MALSVIDLMQDLLIQVADLHRRVEHMLMIGPVADVDADKGYRIDLGPDADGNPVKSPWLPHPESGGVASTWMPLSLGQIAAALSPGGDPEMGFLLRAGYSNVHPAPSQDLGEVVLLNMGAVRISATASAITFKVGAASLVIAADAITLNGQTVHAVGASLQHNDKNVGDTHTHGGVIPGGASTAVPD